MSYILEIKKSKIIYKPICCMWYIKCKSLLKSFKLCARSLGYGEVELSMVNYIQWEI